MESESVPGGRIVFFLAGVAAVVLLYPVSGPTFREVIPAFVAAVALASATRGREVFVLSSILTTGLLLAFFIPDRAGWHIEGIVIAAIGALSLASRARAGIVTQQYATLFVGSVTILLRFVPLSEVSAGSLAVLPAAILLLWVLSHEGSVRVPVLGVTTFFALVAPHEGIRPIAMTMIAVFVVLVMRFPNIYASGLAIAASIISLPWGPVVAASSLLRRSRDADAAHFSLALPVSAAGAAANWIALLPFAPEVVHSRLKDLAPFTLLVIVAVFAPFGISSLALVVAIASVLLHQRARDVRVMAWLPVVWMFAVIARFAESGAMATLVVPRIEARLWGLVIASAVLVAVAARFSRRSAAVVAGAALIAMLMMERPAASPLYVSVDRSLSRGEKTEIQIDADLREIDLILSGARVSTLGADAVLGHVSWIDGSGRGERRVVRAGDAPDWGAFRSSERFGSRNRLPAGVRPRVEGFGASSFAVGEGRLRLRAGAPLRRLRIETAASIPAEARLMVVGFEAVR